MEGEIAVMIPIFASLGSFAMVVLIVYFSLKFRSAARARRHEEVMALIEKGQFDPEMLEKLDPSKRQKSPLYLGMIWLGIGIGSTLGMYFVDMPDVWGWGLIPTFIGLALLIYHFIARKAEKSAEESGPA